MAKKKHRNRAWAPAPPTLNEPIIDNHTHVASVVQYSQYMSSLAASKGQDTVPIYSVEEQIRKSRVLGVEGIIDVGCEYPNLATAVNMAKAYSTVHAAIAIHPNESVLHGHRGDVGPDGLELSYKPWHDIPFDEALNRVAVLAKKNPYDVVAIGETGLDYFRTGEAARKAQREAFRAHIALAKELGLPMQIHDRDAHTDVVDILLRDGAPEGTVFHSYSANEEIAKIAREHGWYLSFSGTVTYKGNEPIRRALAVIDRNHIMVETDAPYLTPMPYRGRTNAPYMIPYTVQGMADVLDISVDEMARITRENTRKCYRI